MKSWIRLPLLVLFLSLALLVVLPIKAEALKGLAPETEKSKAFSFAVHGGSRSMLYIPYKEGQEEKIDKLLVDVFALVLPEKVAEEVVKRDVKLTFDPVTK